MPLALFLAYPALVHLGVLLELPWMQGLALVCLAAGVFYLPLRAGRAIAWGGLLGFAALVFGLMRVGSGHYALYVPPLVLAALGCAAFSSSLRRGQMPLITRIAEAVDGPLNAELIAHTRKITALWALLLAGIFLVTLLLTLTGPREWWSWFTNCVSYVLMALALTLDYAYRRWRFPEHDRDGFVAHLRRVIRGSAATRP